MMEILLALALLAPSLPEAPLNDWRPSGCRSEDRLTARQVRSAKSQAEQGNITASVSLECHYIAIGKPDEAVAWLRQSAEREPLTGQRYVAYLLSVGGKKNCRKAYELTERYLGLKWDFPKLNQNLATQQKRAIQCR